MNRRLSDAALYRAAFQGVVARIKAEHQLQKLMDSDGEDKKMSLTRNSYNDVALRRFAHECARHKIYKTCNNMCQRCALNVSAYSITKEDAVIIQQMADLDIGEAAARRHRIAVEQQDAYARQKKISVLTWAIFIIPCIFLFALFRSCATEAKNDRITRRETQSVPVIETPVRKQAAVDVLAPIRSTLNRVTKRRDIDGDGAVTCVDYTLMFYDTYPNKNNVRIVWNKNASVNMNHLFVKVLVNSQWMPVEPQAYVNPVTDRWFSMRKYWGTRYNSNYDLDVTSNVESIRRQTFAWKR
jgi:hypothetical protein